MDELFSYKHFIINIHILINHSLFKIISRLRTSNSKIYFACIQRSKKGDKLHKSQKRLSILNRITSFEFCLYNFYPPPRPLSTRPRVFLVRSSFKLLITRVCAT